VSALEPEGLEVEAPGPGVAALTDVRGREREVLDVYAAGERDIPTEGGWGNLSFDEWLEETWRQPDLTHEGSFVVLVDGRPGSLSFLLVDERPAALNEMAATLPELRARGLAQPAKRASAAWARDRGIPTIYAYNQVWNTPMLAVNRRLGYRPIKTLIGGERALE
jgi:RimJ/RimL family protein N-acetyltransferase